MKLANGTLIAIKLSEIDLQKTAAAPAPRSAATPLPTPDKPRSLAEATKARTGKKATVVLTDQDVGQAINSGGDESKGGSEGSLEVGSVSATKGDNGYTISGSVMNNGKAEVKGASVLIEGVGDDNKIVNTVFGNVAKDTLAPGEKSTFTAQMPSEGTFKAFNYVPRWIVTRKAPAEEKAEKEKPAGAEEAAAPKPTPTPRLVSSPVPRGDVAAPPASAPMGAPSQPGQGYVPASQEGQPKQPGGGN